jgi:hypothetical protein
MEIPQPLRDAIECAYRAFARVPRPTSLEASPLRDGAKIFRTLVSAPLRDIEGEKIGPYAGWAITTVGSASDYFHFLPRILELAVQNPSWMGATPPVIANRLKLANWNDLPNDQHRAVEDVFESAYRWAVESHPNDVESAADWLCGLAILDAPIGPLLESWQQSPSPNSILQLASFASLIDSEYVSPDGLLGVYWEEVQLPARQIVTSWLRSRGVRDRLASSIGSVLPEDRYMIDHALKCLWRVAN